MRNAPEGFVGVLAGRSLPPRKVAGWVVHYLLDGQDLTEFVVAPNRYSAVEESRKRYPTAYVYHAREEGTK